MNHLVAKLLAFGIASLWATHAWAAPAPPTDVQAEDYGGDDGSSIVVTFGLSPDDKFTEDESAASPVALYTIQRTAEWGGLYEDVGGVIPLEDDFEAGKASIVIGKNRRGEPYWFRVQAVGKDGTRSEFVYTAEDDPTIPTREFFLADRRWLAFITFVICGAVVGFIAWARSGRPLRVRRIAGLEAVDEAVGRACEMGKTCLFVPGVQDINDIQTIAGLTVLSHVAKTSAEYDVQVEVPTSRSLVMTAARETVESAYLAAGRPEGFNPDVIYYVTDEQFGYAAFLSGHMVREEPAACFYFGVFYAESLILAEMGNSIGAIQVAGTAMPAQLPFFVAACDYTLIGEEFFAASAYLSGDPDQLGSLKGQDFGKVLTGLTLIVGSVLATLYQVTGSEIFSDAVEHLRDVILK
ncbi:DUF6754 domain-containing protein [Thalassoroseus pseudoceratinae]|uniref:DUF6754 domain-containing protein n=1 Tax=Thalassoroseus pseudoceratinae TaxID=2713176 RepID=UPI0014202B71|nr:DUF6754 domain-containing protein [Thalassoroseus pseudoceratinae]